MPRICLHSIYLSLDLPCMTRHRSGLLCTMPEHHHKHHAPCHFSSCNVWLILPTHAPRCTDEMTLTKNACTCAEVGKRCHRFNAHKSFKRACAMLQSYCSAIWDAAKVGIVSYLRSHSLWPCGYGSLECLLLCQFSLTEPVMVEVKCDGDTCMTWFILWKIDQRNLVPACTDLQSFCR